MTETLAVLFLVDAEAEPGLLPRLLQPFAKRDLTPDDVHARRQGAAMRAAFALDACPAEVVHLIAGNLGQVVGVTRVEVRPAAPTRAAA